MPIEITGTTGNDSILIPELYPESTDYFEITARRGDDMIIGGDGGDEIGAGKGDDTVDGGAGDDTIRGGKGEDTIDGGSGDDRIIAGKHDDVVNGGLGEDYVAGNEGDDILKGGKGSDEIYGGRGNDMIYGVKGNNQLFGGAGDDMINTGRNGSTANGGSGEDLIRAYGKNGGNHTLTGGTEADTFEFYALSSSKRSRSEITDFELGLDSFVISGVSDDDFMADVLAGTSTATLTDTGEDVVLRLAQGLTVTFSDTELDDFIATYSDTPVV